jgi:hypothetical protein
MLHNIIFLFIGLLNPFQENGIEIYLASSSCSLKIGFEDIDVNKIQLDSLLIGSSEILGYDTLNIFSFTISDSAALRIKSLNIDYRIFCVTSNGRKILAGIFWPCNLSLGMDGFVSFNPGCGIEENKQNKFYLLYCLGPKKYPYSNDPRKDIDLIKHLK